MTFSPAPKPQPKTEKPPRRPLTRSGPIARTGKPKVRNVVRHTRNWKRAYESEDRVIWVKHQRCVCCGYAHGPAYTHNAHVVSGGGSRKADAKFIVPLCTPLHDDLHRNGRATFEALWAIDLLAEAARIQSEWETYVLEANTHA